MEKISQEKIIQEDTKSFILQPFIYGWYLITCIYNLNSYLVSLIFMLILSNYDACYLDFMNFLHWNDIYA